MKVRTAAVPLVWVLAAAMPVAAQQTPAPGTYVYSSEPIGRERQFGSLSEAGRRTMRAALHAADLKPDRAAVDAARDRMLTVLDAERLDPDTLRRAMEEERQAAIAAKTHQQAALIAGFQQLSLADRRAFVAEARDMRERMKARIADARRPRIGSLIPPPAQ